MTMILCGELFNAARVPADRGTYARLKINGRDRGLYILNEGFDKKFLKIHFKSLNGNFFDAGVTQEITEPLHKMSWAEADEYAPLRALVAAARAPNLPDRMKRFEEKLDLDRFISMLAIDTITWNLDGYGMNRNNYRVYHDPHSDKIVFCLHGMDQMFWEPEGPIFPPMKGLVARSLLEIPQARQRYHDCISALLSAVFKADALTNRVEELRQTIRPVLAAARPEAARDHDGAGARAGFFTRPKGHELAVWGFRGRICLLPF